MSRETGECMNVNGFYRSDGRYSIRFMPTINGEWNYETENNGPLLAGHKGVIEVDQVLTDNHGRVQLASEVLRADEAMAYGTELPYSFCYDDGTPCQLLRHHLLRGDINRNEDVQE